MGPNGSGKGARERCNLKELAGLDLAGAVLVQPREDVRELPRLLRRELPEVRAAHIPGGGCVACLAVTPTDVTPKSGFSSSAAASAVVTSLLASTESGRAFSACSTLA
jgi:hypothetical protein